LKEPNRGIALFIDAFSNLEKLAVEIERVIPTTDEKEKEEKKDGEEQVDAK